jgi:acetyl-CoA synthetase
MSHVEQDVAWDRAASWVDGLPDGKGLNIAHEAVVRHAAGPRAGHVALRFLRRSGAVEELTYAALAGQMARFSNVLESLGVGRGERVFLLTGRIPGAYVAALGTLAHGAVLCPLFSAFGPEPLHQRLERGDGAVLVTTAALYRRKVAGLRHSLPLLRHVLVVDAEPGAIDEPGVHSLPALMADAETQHTIAATDPEDMALLHFTSGTTGMPKGAVHVHRAVIAHHATARLALGLGPDDVFWCTADPGWVTGTSYGIIAPLSIGATAVVDEQEFDARRWYLTLQEQRVSVWYTAPTAIRMLMKAGDELPGEFDLSSLRVIASVGEPLNAEAVLWSQRVLGLPIRDNWWQSETGGIMIANAPDAEVRPGSMGRPLPGMDIRLARVDDQHRPVLGDDGTPEFVDGPDQEGMIAIGAGWPSMFRDYLHDHDRYLRCFAGDWYLSGDLASRDADGWFWFVGRADDVIKTAGHLIGPFEVESVLMEHPAVVEAGVIGVPDPVAGDVVKAFVTLRDGVEDSDDLRLDLLGFARRRLGPAVAPRSIVVTPQLPHTRSGKIMRRLLRARELGLPEGDLSTLEDQLHDDATPAPQEPTT